MKTFSASTNIQATPETIWQIITEPLPSTIEAMALLISPCVKNSAARCYPCSLARFQT